jgi:hypothetical protein
MKKTSRALSVALRSRAGVPIAWRTMDAPHRRRLADLPPLPPPKGGAGVSEKEVTGDPNPQNTAFTPSVVVPIEDTIPVVLVSVSDFAELAHIPNRWLRGQVEDGKVEGVKEDAGTPQGFRWMLDVGLVERVRMRYLRFSGIQSNRREGFTKDGVEYRHDGSVRRL